MLKNRDFYKKHITILNVGRFGHGRFGPWTFWPAEDVK